MSSGRKTFEAVPLDQVPEVNEFLGELGLGKLGSDVVAAYVGRNDNWAGVTSEGTAVFVKRVTSHAEDAARRIRRTVAFDACVRAAGQADLRTPRLLGHDTGRRLLAFELLADGSTGSELASHNLFDEELSYRAGRSTGLLHACETDSTEYALDTTRASLPDLSLNEALPLPVFMSLSFGEVNLWNLMHSDTRLTSAIARVVEAEEGGPRVPAHCDLRLDQFLRHAGVLHLTDGEEFRLADPARDVGAFAGEWLHQAVMGLAGAEAGAEGAGVLAPEPSHDQIVARGAARLDELRVHIQRFWAGYCEIVHDIDPGLAVRATAYAGWHLIDRALATAGRSNRLPAAVRAAMGIGRTALLDPEQFVPAVGLGEE